MADNNAPRGRKRTGNIQQGKDVRKRGQGLRTGRVGTPSTPQTPPQNTAQGGHPGAYQGSQQGGPRPGQGYPPRPADYQNRPGTTGAQQSSGGLTRAGKGGIIGIIAIIAAIFLGGRGLFGGGGGLLGSLFGGMSSVSEGLSMTPAPQVQAPAAASSYGDLSSLFGSLGSSSNFSALSGGSSTGAGSSNGWARSANTGKLDTSVASGARDKYTKIRGNGQDTVTMMVYMCGTDLESKNGMATSDLLEMTKAALSDKINIIVYTGGCKQWKNQVISSSVNQVYKVEKGGLSCLVKDDGAKAMTDPATLSAFIRYCAKNFAADRYELIFWDHGGGSISGYGYDEKNSRSGSMNLTGVNKALYDGGVKFDFIGFDACLMATAETALMLSDYADYLIASEETEPGVGWYYTNWLTNFSKNTSLPTVQIGKLIVDDFVDVCGQSCPGQKTTLSVIDLAELEATLPAELKSFAQNTISLIQNDDYKVVSDARGGAREFSTSSKIDQVDLVHLATNIGTNEAKSMADTILGAVKYNRTSPNMTNAYGLSIYFPYRKTSTVTNAVRINDAIGQGSTEYGDGFGDYNRCIQAFATMGAGGQAVSQSSYGGSAGSASGGSYVGSPFGSLLGSLGGAAASSGSSASSMSADMISSILGSMMGGDFFGRSMNDTLDMDATVSYLESNRFDADLVWVNGADGVPEMQLTPKQWSLVQDLELNVFYDDGEGFIDLGMDNIFSFKDNNALVGLYDGAWLSINGQAVAYYYENAVEEGDNYVVSGRIPVLLNGDRAELLVSITEDAKGDVTTAIDGVRWIYPGQMNEENIAVAKGTESVLRMSDGSISLTIDFICDYYAYDGTYQDSYKLGDPIVLKGKSSSAETLTVDGSGDMTAEVVYDLNDALTLADAYFNPEVMSATYRFTDIYGQTYWTPVIP